MFSINASVHIMKRYGNKGSPAIGLFEGLYYHVVGNYNLFKYNDRYKKKNKYVKEVDNLHLLLL